MNKSIKSLFLLSGLAVGAANAATPGERLLGIWTGSEKGYENNVYTDSVVEYAIVQAKDNSAIGYKLEKKQGAANWEKVSSVSATVTSSSVVSTFEQGPASEGRIINNRLELRLDDPATNGELLVRAIRDKNLKSINGELPVIPVLKDNATLADKKSVLVALEQARKELLEKANKNGEFKPMFETIDEVLKRFGEQLTNSL